MFVVGRGLKVKPNLITCLDDAFGNFPIILLIVNHKFSDSEFDRSLLATDLVTCLTGFSTVTWPDHI